MDQVKLSLAWDSYQKNICNGLGLLQQRGEFVDMTLAADGHHVKVHQVVMSLVSPYIKDLVTSAQGSHPIIFLSNISHGTLSSILEYVYTGEVHVSKDALQDVLAAGRALHIKGLEDLAESDTNLKDSIQNLTSSTPLDKPFEKRLNLIDKLKEYKDKKKLNNSITIPPKPCEVFVNEAKIDDDTQFDLTNDDDVCMDDTDITNDQNNSTTSDNQNNISTGLSQDLRKVIDSAPIQFSVSIQNGLQIIHSRFLYHLRYYKKKSKSRQWNCVDYSSRYKCPAKLITNEDNKIVHRRAKHNHPSHDKKILKKIQAGTVFARFYEAQKEAAAAKTTTEAVETEVIETEVVETEIVETDDD